MSKLTRRTFIKGSMAVATYGMLSENVMAQMYSASSPEADRLGKTFRTVCTVNCTSRCNLNCHVQDGSIQSVTPSVLPGRPDYSNACLRGMALPLRTVSEERVKYPMLRVGERGEGKFKRISWDEAFDLITEKIKESQERYGKQSVGLFVMTGNLAKFAWDSPFRFARTIEGTSFTPEGIMSDHGASMGMDLVYGQKRGSHDSRDYMNSKTLIVWGRNLVDTHTSEARFYLNAKQNGTKVIVIDPRFSSTAAIADQWIPIKPGGDTALALGMMSYIISKDLHDKEWLTQNSCGPLLVKKSDGQYLKMGDKFCVVDEKGKVVASDTPGVKAQLSSSVSYQGEKCSTSFALFQDSLKQYTLKWTAEATNISEDVIKELISDYLQSPSAIRMGQGMQRVYNSHSPFRTVATLAAVCGYIGVNGGGASHAGGTSGVNPIPGINVPVFNSSPWADTGGTDASKMHGIQIYDMISKADPYQIDFLWIASSNFLNQSPDTNRVINEVLPKLSFIVHSDPYWTYTAKYADLVLPTTNMFENWDIFDKTPWIMLQQPMLKPYGESKSDIQIFSAVAERLGKGKYWNRTDEDWIRVYLEGSKHPAMAGFNWKKFVEEGMFVRKDGRFDIVNAFMDQKYKTQTGRFEFYSERLKPVGHELPVYTPMLEDPKGPLGKKYPLMFIQYHDRTNVHTQHIGIPAINGIFKEPMLEINPVDAAKRNIKHGDNVKIYNDRGHCVVKAFVTEGIMPNVVAIPQGWTPEFFSDGHYQTLTHLTINPVETLVDETNFAAYDNLVEIVKA
ncbi:molybdopterin oxidoreductase [Denitrovibrio acetiphilus DSM 12809]|uniref:Molybdopterin oxidoreductase n=1 Tax=Denitrovibrio acetiphilus (strain DSM 12809 / NBRC 114555 / N2460) TaxID=522772 RepID=D4H8S1_DENA2|nr:molybdopterin-dependent oxidoreductase [Denitrovibrio acetiphilus]ADD68420.1 molybdopterin oxidoreductase [Denitrovibrio acetiphilus DSM 12809]